MEGRGRALGGAAFALALACGLLWWLVGRDSGGEDSGAASPPPTAASRERSPADTDVGESPFSTDLPDEGTATAVSPLEPADRTESASSDAVTPLAGPVDVTALGRTALSDEDFEALVARLAVDPDLARALSDEFRSESDPQRLARLGRLLGELGGAEASALAAELVFSGDDESREIGLELLRQIQPDSAEARDIVSSLLATESDGDVLLPTLAVLSKNADVDAQTRSALTTQLALLTSHEDARVRRRSLGVLGRWSDDPIHVPALLDGLADPDAKVRQTAAYAFVGREDPDGTIAPRLLTVAASGAETERTRRGAILALKSMALDDAERQRVLDIERGLDRRPR